MLRYPLSAAALLLACAAGAQQPEGPAATPSAQTRASSWLPAEELAQKNIKTGPIEVFAPVSGAATAQDTYDILAPFDGRVEYLNSDLFAYVVQKTVIARMVSTEMAALLDSSTEEGRKQTERRWQEIYKYYDIAPEAAGVLTNIYVEPKTKVLRGDRLFTIARKVVIIGKNTEPLYSKLAKGMTAEMENARDPGLKLKTVLTDHIPLRGAPFHTRVWLEVADLKDGIAIGEPFNGVLFVGRSDNALLVPRGDVLEHGGRKFLLTEIKTGLETADEIEILDHTSIYLAPEAADAEKKNGKTKKAR